MNLIIGLGNPGEKYINTRHNVGKMIINKLADDFKVGLKQKPNFSAELEIIKLDKEKNILANSLTFMNDSGWSVRAIAVFYKISPENIWIIHDDFDIQLGEIKESFDSSSAGHNGIKSIIQELGTQKFHRIRVGIKPTEETQIPLEKFVLEKFKETEIAQLNKAIKKTTALIKNSIFKNPPK